MLQSQTRGLAGVPEDLPLLQGVGLADGPGTGTELDSPEWR